MVTQLNNHNQQLLESQELIAQFSPIQQVLDRGPENQNSDGTNTQATPEQLRQASEYVRSHSKLSLEEFGRQIISVEQAIDIAEKPSPAERFSLLASHIAKIFPEITSRTVESILGNPQALISELAIERIPVLGQLNDLYELLVLSTEGLLNTPTVVFALNTLGRDPSIQDRCNAVYTLVGSATSIISQLILHVGVNRVGGFVDSAIGSINQRPQISSPPLPSPSPSSSVLQPQSPAPPISPSISSQNSAQTNPSALLQESLNRAFSDDTQLFSMLQQLGSWELNKNSLEVEGRFRLSVNNNRLEISLFDGISWHPGSLFEVNRSNGSTETYIVPNHNPGIAFNKNSALFLYNNNDPPNSHEWISVPDGSPAMLNGQIGILQKLPVSSLFFTSNSQGNAQLSIKSDDASQFGQARSLGTNPNQFSFIAHTTGQAYFAPNDVSISDPRFALFNDEQVAFIGSDGLIHQTVSGRYTRLNSEAGAQTTIEVEGKQIPCVRFGNGEISWNGLRGNGLVQLNGQIGIVNTHELLESGEQIYTVTTADNRVAVRDSGNTFGYTPFMPDGRLVIFDRTEPNTSDIAVESQESSVIYVVGDSGPRVRLAQGYSDAILGGRIEKINNSPVVVKDVQFAGTTYRFVTQPFLNDGSYYDNQTVSIAKVMGDGQPSQVLRRNIEIDLNSIRVKSGVLIATDSEGTDVIIAVDESTALSARFDILEELKAEVPNIESWEMLSPEEQRSWISTYLTTYSAEQAPSIDQIDLIIRAALSTDDGSPTSTPIRSLSSNRNEVDGPEINRVISSYENLEGGVLTLYRDKVLQAAPSIEDLFSLTNDRDPKYFVEADPTDQIFFFDLKGSSELMDSANQENGLTGMQLTYLAGALPIMLSSDNIEVSHVGETITVTGSDFQFCFGGDGGVAVARSAEAKDRIDRAIRQTQAILASHELFAPKDGGQRPSMRGFSFSAEELGGVNIGAYLNKFHDSESGVSFEQIIPIIHSPVLAAIETALKRSSLADNPLLERFIIDYRQGANNDYNLTQQEIEDLVTGLNISPSPIPVARLGANRSSFALVIQSENFAGLESNSDQQTNLISEFGVLENILDIFDDYGFSVATISPEPGLWRFILIDDNPISSAPVSDRMRDAQVAANRYAFENKKDLAIGVSRSTSELTVTVVETGITPQITPTEVDNYVTAAINSKNQGAHNLQEYYFSIRAFEQLVSMGILPSLSANYNPIIQDDIYEKIIRNRNDNPDAWNEFNNIRPDELVTQALRGAGYLLELHKSVESMQRLASNASREVQELLNWSINYNLVMRGIPPRLTQLVTNFQTQELTPR
jgi:hypothetical protein